jgi:uncharacterized protein YodC (DUF2158 family)
MAAFQAGMKVRHKSGGPVMIVERTGNDAFTGQARVWCEWFDAANYRHNESFAPAVLEAVEVADGAAPAPSQFFGRLPE